MQDANRRTGLFLNRQIFNENNFSFIWRIGMAWHCMTLHGRSVSKFKNVENVSCRFRYIIMCSCRSRYCCIRQISIQKCTQKSHERVRHDFAFTYRCAQSYEHEHEVAYTLHTHTHTAHNPRCRYKTIN